MAKIIRTLSQLAPGQKYMIRISSVESSGTKSDLSPAYVFTTIKDITAPAVPQFPITDFSTPTFITSWSGSAAAVSTDFKDFQIIVSSSTSSTSGTYYSFSPFRFTVQDNINLFGSATPSINLQIRSRDTSGNLSDPLSTSANNAVPTNITNSTSSFSSPDLYLQWNTVTASSDNDITHYKLTLNNSNIPKTVVYSIPAISNSTTSALFQLTYQQNVNDFGRPSGSFSGSIVAVDIFNQTSSTPRTFTVTNPVPTDYPTITVAPLIKGFSASWSAPSSSFADYSYTEVYASNSTPFFASVTAPVWRGTGTYAEYSNVPNYNTFYVLARHFDLFGQPGPDGPITSVIPINPVVADTIPPATPNAGFYSSASLDSTDISGQRFNITASWTPVADTDLAGYYLKYSLTNTSSALGTVQSTPASANYPVKTNFLGYAGNTYYWWVASYDKSNNTSSWSALQTINVPADTTAPASVTNFAVFANDNIITASWTPVATSTDFNPPVGIGGYRVRSATDSGITANVQTFNSLNNRIGFAVPFWNTTYYVTAQPFDTQGNLGASPTPLSIAIGTDPAISASGVAISAQTSANGKNIIFYNASTTVPTATASGDTWFVVDTTGASITAFRTASAAGTTAWVERPLTNSTISTLDAGKITTGFLNAGRIQANSLSASLITASTAFIDQKISIGGTSSNQINLLAGNASVAGKIYSGAVGLYNNTTTGFYLDGDGYFSLRDKLTFNPTASTLTVAGSIVAQSGQFTGSMTAGTLGIGAFGGGLNGIKINTSNYWYDSGNFSLANGSVTWDGINFLVDGKIIARSGSFSGNIQVGPNGSLFAGSAANSGARTIFNASGVQGYNAAGNPTFLLSASDGSFNLGTKFAWNGSTLAIGDPTSQTGFSSPPNPSGSTVAIYAGASFSNASVAPFRVYYDGRVVATSGSFTGNIYASAGYFTGSINATSGSFTGNVYASAGTFTGNISSSVGSIGGWIITPTALYGGTSPNVTGLDPTNATSTIFAGATSSAGAAAKFNVTSGGILYAQAASFSGAVMSSGSLIGGISATGVNLNFGNTGSIVGSYIAVPATAPYKFTVDSSGNMIAQSASITGQITASAGTIGGWLISSSALTSSSVGLYAPTSPLSSDIAIFAGSALANRATAPFKVDYAGNLTATNANITGSVNATSGSFSGNISASTGNIGGFTIGLNSLSATNIVLSSTTGLNLGSNQFTVNQAGAMVAQSASIVGQITASAGSIGGWSISTSSLTAGAAGTRVALTTGNYAIYAGNDIPSSAPFSVTNSGNLIASNASIAGQITASVGNIGGWSLTSQEIGTGTGTTRVALNSSASPKIYIGYGNYGTGDTGFYVDSNGYFSLGNQLTFAPSKGSASIITLSATYTNGSPVITTTYNNSASTVIPNTIVTSSVLPTGVRISSITYTTNATITLTSNYSGTNGTYVTTLQPDNLSLLNVNGTIRGVIDSVTPIASPTLFANVTSASINTTASTILFTASGGHFFSSSAIVIFTDLPNINGLNLLNYSASSKGTNAYTIVSIPNSTQFFINYGSLAITPSGIVNTSGSGRVSIQQLTMGFHPPEGASATDSWYHDSGNGIRLDSYNWWLVNNQFRVGNPLTYFKYDGTRFQIQGGNTLKLIMQVGAQNSSNQIAITNGTTGSFSNVNTPFYVDGTGSFSLGNQLTWDGSSLIVNGQINVTGGNAATNTQVSNASSTLNNNINTLSSSVSGSVNQLNTKTSAFDSTGALANPMTVLSAGSIKAGKTAWQTGTGWLLEFNGGTPRFDIGNPAGNYMQWDGASLTINGTINVTGGTAATNNQVNTASTSLNNSINTSSTTLNNSINTLSGSVSGSVTALTGSATTLNGKTAAITASSGAPQFFAPMTVISGGEIKAGKTVYGTGIGWYVGYNGSNPAIDIGSTTNYLRFDGSNVYIAGSATINGSGSFTGNVYATSGSFSGSVTSQYGNVAGWTLEPNLFYAQTSGRYYGMALNGGVFYAGATDKLGTNAYFYADPNGFMYSSSANIGGWSLEPGLLYAQTSGKYYGMSVGTGNVFYAGGINKTGVNSLFVVNSNGFLYSTSANIGGWTVNQAGITSACVGIYAPVYPTAPASNEISFFAGSAVANRSTAPFRVDYSGNLYATSASITGFINGQSGSIGGWAISSNSINSTSGSAGTYLFTQTVPTTGTSTISLETSYRVRPTTASPYAFFRSALYNDLGTITPYLILGTTPSGNGTRIEQNVRIWARTPSNASDTSIVGYPSIQLDGPDGNTAGWLSSYANATISVESANGATWSEVTNNSIGLYSAGNIDLQSGNIINIGNDNLTSYIYLGWGTNSTTRAVVRSVAIYNTPTTSTANDPLVFFGSTPNYSIYRFSSKQEYKKDIFSLSNFSQLSPSVLSNKILNSSSINIYDAFKIVPVTYKSLLPDDDQNIENFGFIAEDVADKMPQLATYDEDGNPKGYGANGMIAILWAVVQEQQIKIEELTSSVTMLLNK